MKPKATPFPVIIFLIPSSVTVQENWVVICFVVAEIIASLAPFNFPFQPEARKDLEEVLLMPRLEVTEMSSGDSLLWLVTVHEEGW